MRVSSCFTKGYTPGPENRSRLRAVSDKVKIAIGTVLNILGLAGVVGGVLWLTVFTGEPCEDYRRAPLDTAVELALDSGTYDISLEYDGAFKDGSRRYKGMLDFKITSPEKDKVFFEELYRGTYRTCRYGTWAGSFEAFSTGVYQLEVAAKKGVLIPTPVTVAVSSKRPATLLFKQVLLIGLAGVIMTGGVLLIIITMTRRQAPVMGAP